MYINHNIGGFPQMQIYGHCISAPHNHISTLLLLEIKS